MAAAKTKARGGEPRALLKFRPTRMPEVHPTGHYAPSSLTTLLRTTVIVSLVSSLPQEQPFS
jgi:hypothetical protein